MVNASFYAASYGWLRSFSKGISLYFNIFQGEIVTDCAAAFFWQLAYSTGTGRVSTGIFTLEQSP
ncbi:hypothetical protein AOX59_16770 [Lentibacillus amyloliquefaciens]|uniref:Uncharacterized protein n=1 Tax=Lentibacillus amyloliquefaciens TaxID=1472767 RepID=A0A0U4FQV1_9BACI|nr:hypothetical protein AOX59_16770 [Lentibacillus amyloliquefaciens]